MEHSEGTFEGDGGLKLYCQTWRPQERIRGVLVIVHGMGEYSGRYQHLAEYLISRDLAIHTFDLRGHGRSPGHKGHVRRWQEYLNDLDAFINYVARRESGCPIILYGHSFGTLIVLDYIESFIGGVQGVILSGVAIEPGEVATKFQQRMARMMSKVWPTFSFKLNLKPEKFSRDPQVVQSAKEDPQIFNRATARWGIESLSAIEHITEKVPNIRIPILILHGGADKISLPEGAIWLHENVSSSNRTLKIYPGGYHEPHNDLEREEVFSDISQWLETYLAPQRGAVIPDRVN